MYQVIKERDEGSSSPFIARLFMTMLEFRDNLFLSDIEGDARVIMQDYFDRKFKPMFEAAEAVRDASHKINQLIEAHKKKIEDGTIVKITHEKIEINESIDKPLSQLIDQLLDQSIVATKTGLQQILTDLLRLDIGFFFQTEKQFEVGVSRLNDLGENLLSQYLTDVRNNWHKDIQELRVRHEHEGWSLSSIEYQTVEASRVEMVLPKIEGLDVNEFARKTSNRVLLFIENMMVYALQRVNGDAPIYVIEIPKECRDPKYARKFELGAMGLSTSPPWFIMYQDEFEF
jgi:hypothetical protein